MTWDDTNPERIALGVLGGLALVCAIGLVIVGGGDGLVTGQRGPRLGAFVHGNLAAAGLFGVGGLLLAVATVRPLRVLVLAGGAVLTAGALIHLGSLAVGADLIGGSGSTVAAFLGLGVGALAIGATPPAVAGRTSRARRSEEGEPAAEDARG